MHSYTQVERAAKAALVQQALDRKKANAGQTPKPEATASDAPGEPTDIATLEKQLTQAEAKLNTMQGMLDDAKAQQADNVEKLERAVAKNHDRVERARRALKEAQDKAQAKSEPQSSE